MRAIRTPKQAQSAATRPWYPYYAGYQAGFVADLLDAIEPAPSVTVCDPWNGSGTTTVVAEQRGLAAIGFDMNPVMVLVAKGRHLPSSLSPSLKPLGIEILHHAQTLSVSLETQDALGGWFRSDSARRLRALQVSIDDVLVDLPNGRQASSTAFELHSPLAGFFYTAAFSAVRSLLLPLRTSNPNWLITPADGRSKLRPSQASIDAAFLDAVDLFSSRLTLDEGPTAQARLERSDSTTLPLDDDTVDLVITSPPYCTRLDYAMATRGELAFLGIDGVELRSLRESDFGSPVAVKQDRKPSRSSYVNDLLQRITQHESKASSSYYRGYFERYFSSLEASIDEVARILKPGGQLCMVVQDSSYKDLRIDLQRAVEELARESGIDRTFRSDYRVPHSRAYQNPKHRRYWQSPSVPTESLLVFS